MNNEIKRATGLLVIEVVNSNPNGDPDRESDPRQRPQVSRKRPGRLLRHLDFGVALE